MMVQEDENVTLTKGKVAKIEEDSATGDVTVTVEDILGGGKVEATFDMVVLAAGMEPAAKSPSIPARPRLRGQRFHGSRTSWKRHVRLRRRTQAGRCLGIGAGCHRSRTQEHSEQRRRTDGRRGRRDVRR